jgi:HK97 gp10 family phage protein
MADGVTLRVDGLKELADKLRAMGPDLSRVALRAGVRDAAKLVRDDAKLRNPDDTKLTEENIYIQHIGNQSSDTQQTFFVGVRSRRGRYSKGKKKPLPFYWRYIEFGTSKAAARPFMRPAFEQNIRASIDAIAAQISKRIKSYDRKQSKLANI